MEPDISIILTTHNSSNLSGDIVDVHPYLPDVAQLVFYFLILAQYKLHSKPAVEDIWAFPVP